MGNPSQSYRASLAIWDHTVLPATRHKWRHPAITPANQANTRFTYPRRMEGWVDLSSLIAAWPGIKPTITWSQVRRPNSYATESRMIWQLLDLTATIKFSAVILLIWWQEGSLIKFRFSNLQRFPQRAFYIHRLTQVNLQTCYCQYSTGLVQDLIFQD